MRPAGDGLESRWRGKPEGERQKSGSEAVSAWLIVLNVRTRRKTTSSGNPACESEISRPHGSARAPIFRKIEDAAPRSPNLCASDRCGKMRLYVSHV